MDTMKENSFKFLHSGDFHLGSYFYSSDLPIELVESRRENIWTAVEGLFNLAKEKKVDCIFLCGDIFNENYVTLSILERLNSLFSSVPFAKIFIIFGNHDPYSLNSKFKYINLSPNVYVFKNDKIESFKFKFMEIYGISYNDRILNKSNYFDNLTLDHNKINVLMLHTDIINPNFNYMNLNIKDIESLGFDYVALGHIHKPQKITENIIYPGSIEPLSFKETGNHGAIYGEIKKGRLKTDFIPLSKSIFNQINYEFRDNFDFYSLINHLKKHILKDDADNYIRLILRGKLPAGFDLDVNALKEAIGKYVKFVDIIDKTQENYDIDKIYEL
ncbi:MAG: DNA repair exonuclease, partial [Lagierella massiliensis]|nr:DNA repair exonuclease [Lagierella massiliensis]